MMTLGHIVIETILLFYNFLPFNFFPWKEGKITKMKGSGGKEYEPR